MATGGLVTRFATLRNVPTRILALTVLAVVAGIAFGIVQGWPFWALALVFVVVLTPVLTIETSWTWRHYGWLGLFYVLVVTQGGHVIEHVAQVTQIHVLNTPKPQAHGIFGALDVEWVHVIWNTWVLAATLALTIRFRRNRWLWAGLAIALWHESEHLYLIAKYVATGLPGNPGLLADGGIIGGGVPVARPDLHFFYNILETTPIVMAFIAQLRHTYDEWFATAFPSLPKDSLVAVTTKARTERYAPGDIIVAEGDLPRAFYVVTSGEVDVSRRLPLREAYCGTLGAGKYFGEIGLLENVPRTATVRAKTRAELLALDKDAFEDLLTTHEPTRLALAQAAAAARARDRSQDSATPPSNPTSASTA